MNQLRFHEIESITVVYYGVLTSCYLSIPHRWIRYDSTKPLSLPLATNVEIPNSITVWFFDKSIDKSTLISHYDRSIYQRCRAIVTKTAVTQGFV